MILKPIILGWANYYSICECSLVFNKLDRLTFQMLRAWLFRRDRINNRTDVKEKCFPSGNKYVYKGKPHFDNLILVGKKKFNNDQVYTTFLPKFSWTQSKVHIKMRSDASIFNGNNIYWDWRTMEYGGFSYNQKRLLKRQNRLCTWCNSPININDKVEVDPIFPKSKKGPDTYNNLQLLHLQCHIEKTSSNTEVKKDDKKFIFTQH